MLKVRIDQQSFRAEAVSKPAEDVKDTLSFEEYLQVMTLECLASLFVTYSLIYIPEPGDNLAQYVTSIAIFTVSIVFRDSHFFMPDSTPMVTCYLWSATLYSDIQGKTDWIEISCRLFGQAVGYCIVLLVAWSNQAVLAASSYLCIHSTNDMTHAFNEGIGTMLEGVAIAFAMMPILSPYASGPGVKSKKEAKPPKIWEVSLVALSLASIHYTLERILQATMSPYATYLQYFIQGRTADVVPPIVAQLLGIIVACAYVRWTKPTSDIIVKLTV